MRQTTSLNPPTSDGLLSRCSKRQPRSSAKRWYIRSRSPANREASSPPVPARISMMASRSSVVSRGSRLYCTSLRSFSRAASSSGISRRPVPPVPDRPSWPVPGCPPAVVPWRSEIPCFHEFLQAAVLSHDFRGLFLVIEEVRFGNDCFNSSRRWRRFQ